MIYTSIDDLINDCAARYILLLREKPISLPLSHREIEKYDYEYFESQIPGFWDKVCNLVAMDLLER